MKRYMETNLILDQIGIVPSLLKMEFVSYKHARDQHCGAWTERLH